METFHFGATFTFFYFLYAYHQQCLTVEVKEYIYIKEINQNDCCDNLTALVRVDLLQSKVIQR